MRKLTPTIFSWGYWGWGNATVQLIAAVDSVEATRAFAPPMFVEVRFERGARAPGFRGATFEQTVGEPRYRWMKDLGNKAVGTNSGPRIQIARPAAANELLDLALEAAERKQRVIFFCACEVPAYCHRATVAKLVSAAAHRRGVPIEVIEWPGGEPDSLELKIPDSVMYKLARGRKTVPLPEPVELARFAGLPWYSNVLFKSDREQVAALCSPAAYDARFGWHLKILARTDGEDEDELLKASRMNEYRHEQGYDAVA